MSNKFISIPFIIQLPLEIKIIIKIGKLTRLNIVKKTTIFWIYLLCNNKYIIKNKISKAIAVLDTKKKLVTTNIIREIVAVFRSSKQYAIKNDCKINSEAGFGFENPSAYRTLAEYSPFSEYILLGIRLK